MWSCTFYLGNFLGPTLAGLAVEKYGFRATTIGFFALDSGIILVDLFAKSNINILSQVRHFLTCFPGALLPHGPRAQHQGARARRL